MFLFMQPHRKSDVDMETRWNTMTVSWMRQCDMILVQRELTSCDHQV